MGPYGGSGADPSYLEDPHGEPHAVQNEFSKAVLDKSALSPIFFLNFLPIASRFPCLPTAEITGLILVPPTT